MLNASAFIRHEFPGLSLLVRPHMPEKAYGIGYLKYQSHSALPIQVIIVFYVKPNLVAWYVVLYSVLYTTTYVLLLHTLT